MSNPNRFYNYAYLDPEKPGEFSYGIITFTHEPFYIGKGTGKRYKQHKYGKTGRFMRSKLKRIFSKGLEPIIIVFNNNCTNDHVCDIEKALINNIGRRDLKKGPLCNHTDGGEEGLNQTVTKRSRELQRLKLIGKPLSEEHKKKIGLANKGKISQITRKAQKEFMDLNKDIIYGKKVYKTDLEGNVLKEYISMKEAAKDNNVKWSFVQNQCRFPEIKPRFVNFKFKYKNDN